MTRGAGRARRLKSSASWSTRWAPCPSAIPKVEELFNQAMTIYMEELPVIPVTQAKKIIPFDTTYWTNWPTYDNQYIHPPTWWQHFHVILQNLQATGAQ